MGMCGTKNAEKKLSNKRMVAFEYVNTPLLFILCLVSNVVLPFSDSIFLSAVVKRRKREHKKSEQNSTDHIVYKKCE